MQSLSHTYIKIGEVLRSSTKNFPMYTGELLHGELPLGSVMYVDRAALIRVYGYVPNKLSLGLKCEIVSK